MAGLIDRLLRRKKDHNISCCAIVPAAGAAQRMQGRDKILLPLGGEPLLVHTLRQLQECQLIHDIIVVTRENMIVDVGQLCKDYCFTKVSKVVVGGNTRQQSVYMGLCQMPDNVELVAIHDGARPFVTPELLEEVILRGAECGAAAPAVPVKDTVKRAKNGLVYETLDRSDLYQIQTPQVFEAALIRAALLKVLQDGAELTDDCAAVERLGMKVALTQGSEENIKITTPTDLLLGEAILEGREP